MNTTELTPEQQKLLDEAKSGTIFPCVVIGEQTIKYNGRSEDGYSVELPNSMLAYLHHSQTGFPTPRSLMPGEVVRAKLIKIGRWQYAPSDPSKDNFTWSYYEDLPLFDPVVSVSVQLRETRRDQRQLTLSQIQVGKRLQGKVQNVLPYGVFVDVGGISGLTTAPEGVSFQVGQEVSVEVTAFDPKSERVSLKFC